MDKSSQPSPRALADAQELMDAWSGIPIQRDVLLLNIAALLTARERETAPCPAGR